MPWPPTATLYPSSSPHSSAPHSSAPLRCLRCCPRERNPVLGTMAPGRNGPLCPVLSRGQSRGGTALSPSRPAGPGAPRCPRDPRDPRPRPHFMNGSGGPRLPVALANQKIALAPPANQRLSLGRLETSRGGGLARVVPALPASHGRSWAVIDTGMNQSELVRLCLRRGGVAAF